MGMRVDRWRDNIHGGGASRLSLKASREISQFLGRVGADGEWVGAAHETDGDTRRFSRLNTAILRDPLFRK